MKYTGLKYNGFKVYSSTSPTGTTFHIWGNLAGWHKLSSESLKKVKGENGEDISSEQKIYDYIETIPLGEIELFVFDNNFNNHGGGVRSQMLLIIKLDIMNIQEVLGEL